jgi:hypothetical protein
VISSPNCIATRGEGDLSKDMIPFTDEMLDVKFCLRKAGEYRAKAAGSDNVNLKASFEAAAREYDSRAKENAVRDFKTNTS